MDPSTTLIIKLYEEGRENNKRILQLTTDLIAARVEITELKTQLRGRSMTQSPEVVVRNASAPPMNSLRRGESLPSRDLFDESNISWSDR